MKYAIVMLALLFPVLTYAKDPVLPRVAKIDGPCSLIAGQLCYGAYDRSGKSWFGVYSFNDPTHKVSLVEPFDCSHPNGRMKWGSASKSDPEGTFPVYNSTRIKGLYASCYGQAE